MCVGNISKKSKTVTIKTQLHKIMTQLATHFEPLGVIIKPISMQCDVNRTHAVECRRL